MTGTRRFLAVASLLVSARALTAGEPAKLTGSIAGIVRDNAGIPQMGATVLLFNRAERIIQRALMNDKGVFGFDFLPTDVYAVRISLPSFVPALKQKIAVQPGVQSLLYINMATLFSSVELVYAAPGQGALMSDDWRWTLKTSTASRPILRFLPAVSVSDPNEPQHAAGAIFSDTRGMLKVSAGDGGVGFDPGMQSDLGTAFALATSVFGRSRLAVTGDLGHMARAGIPTASFRTSYRQSDGGPEIAVTMRQAYLPMRLGASVGADGTPALRSMSMALVDRLDITDGLRFEYGTSLDSITFVDRLNYLSPFARLSFEMGDYGTFRVAYSSGAPPAELFTSQEESEAALHQDLQTLALAPRVSLADGRATVQRNQSVEIGYEKRVGNRTVNLTAYRESVSNGAVTMAGADSAFPAGDFLPSLSDQSGTFNVGNYRFYGYSACMTQPLGEHLEFSGSAGRSGVLTAGENTLLDSGSGDDIRSRIHMSQRYWAAVQASGVVPATGTQVGTSYQWMDYNTILPSHLYLTQHTDPNVGWNVHIRQPIRNFSGFSGRLEATIDFRNMLAQGYIGMVTADGRRLVLTQSPRAVRGGISFIF
ncbi:MAG: TonB-dependent receptor [Acidobacteriaceae bacterium]|nr:TonB-dependent receptor [Acidobacteriaceae bacterium]